MKDRVKEILKTYNVQYFMPSGSMYGKAGAADFICCYKGQYIAIETKAGRGKQTPPQMKFAGDITQAGGVYLLITEFNYTELGTYLC